MSVLRNRLTRPYPALAVAFLLLYLAQVMPHAHTAHHHGDHAHAEPHSHAHPEHDHHRPGPSGEECGDLCHDVLTKHLDTHALPTDTADSGASVGVMPVATGDDAPDGPILRLAGFRAPPPPLSPAHRPAAPRAPPYLT